MNILIVKPSVVSSVSHTASGDYVRSVGLDSLVALEGFQLRGSKFDVVILEGVKYRKMPQWLRDSLAPMQATILEVPA